MPLFYLRAHCYEVFMVMFPLDFLFVSLQKTFHFCLYLLQILQPTEWEQPACYVSLLVGFMVPVNQPHARLLKVCKHSNLMADRFAYLD